MFQGSLVAISTPMKKNGEVDYDSYSRLISFHLENKSDGIVPVGTTGESATLNTKEHNKVIQFVVNEVKGKIPVIAGTGANSTTEAIELTQHAKEAGSDGCLLVTPYYNKPTQEGLFQHYKQIANDVSIPILLYNVPGRTSCDMQPQTVQRLSNIGNIIGIKEAVDSVERIKTLIELCGNDFLIISGDDPTAMHTILSGGKGVITVTGNIMPMEMHMMCKAALDGDEAKAREFNEKMSSFYELLFIESNPIPVKYVLYKMGLIQDGIRLPLTWLSKEKQKYVDKGIREAKLI
jgi:4-hydroxy-tetrahydrodipicolinate synthase